MRLDEAPVGRREARRVVPMYDIDTLGAGLGQERRRLEGALAPPHNQDAGPGELIRPRQVGGVGVALRAKVALDPRWEAGERRDPGSHYDGIGPQSMAVLELRLQQAARPVQVVDAHAAYRDALGGAKPLVSPVKVTWVS
jgi:hypothetical protein